MKCSKLQPTLSCLLILTQRRHCSREGIHRESLYLDLTWKRLAKIIMLGFLVKPRFPSALYLYALSSNTMSELIIERQKMPLLLC